VSAGVPGLGLSGLFVLLSALALPLARRRGPPRRRVAALFTLGVVMSAVAMASWRAVAEAVTIIHHPATRAHGHRPAPTFLGPASWPALVLVISASIMVLVLLAAEALLHLVGVTPTPTPPPVTPLAQTTARSTETPQATSVASDPALRRCPRSPLPSGEGG
jgi:hypothetical protein